LTQKPDPTDFRRVPVENPWRETLRRLSKQQKNFAVGRSFARQRTIENWISPTVACPFPDIATMRMVEAELGYSLAQQLIDLDLVSPNEVNVGITALPSSTSLVLGRLDLAVAALTSDRYDIWDLARYVTDSCVHTGVPGRWRARVFDVPGGEAFRHGAYRAVEFLRAQLPGEPALGSASDTLATERICRELAPDTGTWPDRVDFPVANDGTNRAHWLERIELGARMRKIRDFMVLTEYGGEGSLHLPLVNNSERDERHIFVDVDGAHRAHDPREMTGINTALRANSLGTGTLPGGKVIVIGPPSINNLAICRMTAGALGWPAQTIREQASATGVSRLNITARKLDTTRIAQTMDQNTSWRPVHPTIISLSSIPAAANEHDALCRLLHDDFAVPILIHPSMDLLEEWEHRQEKASTRGFSSNSNAVTVSDGLKRIGQILKQRRAPFISAKFNTSDVDLLPWAKPGYFVHPRIGDYTVRAAYQFAYVLTHGEKPPTSARVTRLMPDSVLARFEHILRSGPEGGRRPLRITINKKPNRP
jgi:hypothetical protein